MVPSDTVRKGKRRRELTVAQEARREGSSSVDVTPKRPHKRQRIRKRSRKPDPFQSSTTSQTSSLSSLSVSQPTEAQPNQRSLNAVRKHLRFSSQSTETPKPWSEEELKALVNYLMCRGIRKTWPASKDPIFWTSAANFIADCSPDHNKRTGSACRNKVLRTLRKRFKSPEAAESHYFPLKLVASEPQPAGVETAITPSLQSFPSHTKEISPSQQLLAISEHLKSFCNSHSSIDPPDDFLSLAVLAMQHLRSCGRSNVVYKLVKVLGTMRDDQSDSLLPARRMPMGLIEHCVNFFSSSSIREIHCPDDYRNWLGSMFSLFGTKFVKLYSGPMWRVETTSQDQAVPAENKVPIAARTNVPGLSERTLQRDIVASGVTMGAEIQTLLLDSASKANPHAIWWIKGDGCDVVPGICESVNLKWSGDIDLNTGELQASYQAYRGRLRFIAEIGLKTRQERRIIVEDLKKVHQQLVDEKDFAIRELSSADTQYHEKLKSSENSTRELFTFGWKVEELTQLVDRLQTTITTVSSVIDMVADPTIDLVDVNVARQLSDIRETVTSLVQDLTRQKRIPATHIFVLMISSELRDIKPYALPVQCLPYHSITQQQLRQLVSKLVKEMTSRGMKVAGFCSNGEYNAMRNQGYTRPLSILKIRSNVRSKYAKMSKKRMISMLSSSSSTDGRRLAEVQNPAISQKLLLEISRWRDDGVEWSDIISRLRPRTVPSGYVFSPWKAGQEETEIEKLRSILAQMEFTYVVRQYDDRGIPFRTHLHVPETHPDTGTVFMEREDEGHVLKRIAQCTRNGGPPKLQLERYIEALHDSEAGLTYPALVGSRKQSVQDAERLFSSSLLRFMDEKGYEYEARYIRAIRGWRQACDQRGLSELERCRHNYNLLNFILEEWMPWYTQSYDFSLLEVNRDVTSVCGFTREVLSALIANIETTELRRQQIAQDKLQPSNPRASNTDDVECFFSVMRDHVGTNFTLKQAQFAWRKVCVEFQKRIRADLPYYYFTSAHDRFYEGPRPSFNDPPKKNKKQRLPRSEQVHTASFASGRASFPVRGTLTIRPKFHKHPVSVPPPSSIPSHVAEHSYAQSK